MYEIGENLLKRNREERKNYYKFYEELVEEMELEQRQIEEEEFTKIKKNEKVELSEKTKISEIAEENKAMEMVCPKCGAKLVLRTAKKGANIGKQFYGCSAFPKCFYTRKIENEEAE